MFLGNEENVYIIGKFRLRRATRLPAGLPADHSGCTGWAGDIPASSLACAIGVRKTLYGVAA